MRAELQTLSSHGTSFSAAQVASGESKHTVPLLSHPRPASGSPNNNDEIAVRGGDNEETMSGKDTECSVGRDKKKERERESRGRREERRRRKGASG